MVFHENIFPFIDGKASISNPFTSITEVDSLASSSSSNDSFVTPITIQVKSIACSNPISDPILVQVSSLYFDSSHAAFDSTDSSVPSLPMSIIPTFVTPVPASTSAHEPPSAPIRRSSRQSTKPIDLQDYACVTTHVFGAPYDVADGLTPI